MYILYSTFRGVSIDFLGKILYNELVVQERGLSLWLALEEKDITQKDLADFLGVTPKAISFYELGQRMPSNDVILKLAQKFGVTTDYLLGNDVDPNKLSNYIGPVVENKKIPIIVSVKCGINGLAFQYL